MDLYDGSINNFLRVLKSYNRPPNPEEIKNKEIELSEELIGVRIYGRSIKRLRRDPDKSKMRSLKIRYYHSCRKIQLLKSELTPIRGGRSMHLEKAAEYERKYDEMFSGRKY